MLKKIIFLGLSCMTSVSFALTPVSLALDWYINPDHAPILAAETQGYFAQNGLEVTLIQPTQTSEVRNLVAAHQALIGIDYEPEALIAIDKGLPLQIVGNLVPTPLSCIATLQAGPIKTLTDLSGKTLGYSGDPIEKEFLQVELQHAGVDPTTVTLQPIQMDLSQALLSKTVDAVNGMMRNVEPIMLEKRGIQTRLFYPEQNGIPTYSELVFITHTGTDPKTVAAFLKAVGEGAAYVKAHPEASWQKAQAQYPTALATSPQIAVENQAIWQASVPYFALQPATINQKVVTQFKQFLMQAGLIKP